MKFGKCKRCGKGMRCKCMTSAGLAAEVKKQPSQRVAPHNKNNDWCSCGCLVRNGRCVSSLCGKVQ